MTLSLYSTYKAWKREKAREAAMFCPVRFPVSRKPRSVMQMLARLGMGIGGVSAGDDEYLNGIG